MVEIDERSGAAVVNEFGVSALSVETQVEQLRDPPSRVHADDRKDLSF